MALTAYAVQRQAHRERMMRAIATNPAFGEAFEAFWAVTWEPASRIGCAECLALAFDWLDIGPTAAEGMPRARMCGFVAEWFCDAANEDVEEPGRSVWMRLVAAELVRLLTL